MKENQIVQAGVGRKFQTPSIYDDLTVFENLESPIRAAVLCSERWPSSVMPQCAIASRKSPR